MADKVLVRQCRLEDDFIPFMHRFERVFYLLLKIAAERSNVDNGRMSTSECRKELGFVRVPLCLYQFGLVIILGSRERRIKIDRIQSREMLALEVVDQV